MLVQNTRAESQSHLQNRVLPCKELMVLPCKSTFMCRTPGEAAQFEGMFQQVTVLHQAQQRGYILIASTCDCICEREHKLCMCMESSSKNHIVSEHIMKSTV